MSTDSASQQPLRIHLSASAAEEIPPALLMPYLSRITDAFARGLHRTSGSTLKRLRGPFAGQAFRVRWGSWRAPVSLVPDWEGGSHIFVHQFAERDEVYLTAQFRQRLHHFHEQLWDREEGRFEVRPADAGYRDVTAEVAPVATTERDEVRFELVPSGAQLGLLRAVLPFPGAFLPDSAVVVLGHGAPGSGKTALAMEAARVAAQGDTSELSPYSVLILVPSVRLHRLYEESLRSNGLQWGNMGRAIGGAPESVTLTQAERFFAMLAGVQSDEATRQRRLAEWWGRMLERSDIKAWAKDRRHREAIESARFLRLMDATLLDPQGLGEHRKDALDEHDRPLYGHVHDLRRILALNGSQTNGGLAKVRQELGVPLRSEIADACLTALAPVQGAAGQRGVGSADPWKGRLLVLVDEAQDLIPSEWTALLEWGAARMRAGGERTTRIALLGDENQRISPTAFSWNEVKERWTTDIGLSHKSLCSVPLPGSFRLNRRIAALAGELFHPSVSHRSKFRNAERADPAALRDEGSVRVLVVAEAKRRVFEALGRVQDLQQGDTRLQIVVEDDAEGNETKPEAKWLDIFPPRLIKGLEFARLAVVEPFGGSGEELSFDAAAVAYTAMTRAVDDLLVVLTPAEWRLVEDRWRVHSPEVELLDASRSGMEVLVRALGRLLGEVDVDSRVEFEMARLRAELDQVPMKGGKHEGRGRLKRMAVSAALLVRLGRVSDLAAEFGGALYRFEWLAPLTREIAGDAATPADQAVGLLVLFDEYAAAWDLGRQSGVLGEELVAELDRLTIAESPHERAARAIRRATPIQGAVSKYTLLQFAMAAEAAKAVRAIPLPALEV